MKRSVRLLAACVSVHAAAAAHGAVVYYVSTGQAGALASIDTANTQYWEFALSTGVTDFGGGNFVMKRSNANNSSSITFTLYDGTYANRLSSTVLMSVTLLPASVTTSYSQTIFSTGSALSLLANRTYTITLTSSAATNQSYAIKGGTGVPLGWVDSAGNSVTVPSGAVITTDPVPVPGPGAAVTLALAGLGSARSRRRRA